MRKKVLLALLGILSVWLTLSFLSPPAQIPSDLPLQNKPKSNVPDSPRIEKNSSSPSPAQPPPNAFAPDRERKPMPLPRNLETFHFPSELKIKNLKTYDWSDDSEALKNFGDPRFDEEFLKNNKRNRNGANAWQEDTFRPVKLGWYDATVFSLGETKNRTLFFADIEKLSARGTTTPYVASIRAQDNGAWKDISYSQWQSPYFDNEVYFGGLHFPYDDFWKGIFRSLPCQEILALHISLVSGVRDPTYTNWFDARVYCRIGLNELTPVGMMIFSHSSRDH